MSEKPSVTINVYGGNNQVFPNATEAVQHIYVGAPSGVQSDDTPSASASEAGLDTFAAEKALLLAYIGDRQKLESYIVGLGECTDASELAQLTVSLSRDCGIDKSIIVKSRFIRLLFPFAHRVTHGKSVDNVRARINGILTR